MKEAKFKLGSYVNVRTANGDVYDGVPFPGLEYTIKKVKIVGVFQISDKDRLETFPDGSHGVPYLVTFPGIVYGSTLKTYNYSIVGDINSYLILPSQLIDIVVQRVSESFILGPKKRCQQCMD